MPSIQERQVKVIAEADKYLLGLEDRALSRVDTAMQAGFENMLKQLRRKMGSRDGVEVLRDRAVLIANDMGSLLNILSPDDPRTKALLSDFNQLIATADENGNKLADSLTKAYEPDTVSAASSAKIPQDVVAAVATEGYKNLLRRGDQFASNASQIIIQGTAQGWAYSKTASLLKGQLRTTRAAAEMIVRTETARAETSATKERYAEHGIDTVIWIATQDTRVCPRCAARAGKVYKAGDVVLPLHPQDRCRISPIKQEWVDLGLVDTDWLSKHSAECIAKAGSSDSSASPWELGGAPKAIKLA